MNKELIKKKYKKEFEHWLNGGNLLMADENENVWITLPDNAWNLKDPFTGKLFIVINDDFVEIRKAIAEGKTVEYNFGNFGQNRQDFPDVWKELDLSIGIIPNKTSPENYRIKSELEVRVGEWLLDTKYKTYDRVKEVFDTCVRIQSDFYITKDTITDGTFKIWRPEIGEWCIEDISDSVNFDNKHFIVQQWRADSTWTPVPYTVPLPYFIKG